MYVVNVRQAVFQFKLKLTIKYVKCKYKSSSQLLMQHNNRMGHQLPKIFARPKMAHNIQNNNGPYSLLVCASYLFRVLYTLNLLPYYLSIANGTSGVGIFHLLVFQCFV